MNPDGPSKKPTPEERLLRLIRGKAKSEPKQEEEEVPSGEASPVESVDVQQTTKIVEKRSWISLLVVMLSVVVAIEVAALVTEAMRPLPIITIPIPSADASQIQASSPAPVIEAMPSLTGSVRQSVFAAPINETQVDRKEEKAVETLLRDLSIRLALIGVIMGDPSQAIIEDSQTNRTYFVSIGQPVVEGTIVKSVNKNRVVLDLEGKTIDLTL